MKDWVKNIDRAINNMNSERRIIFFYSENRHVIRDAINQSVALRERLQVSTDLSQDIYRIMCRHSYECFEYTRLFSMSGVRGNIEFKQGKKKETDEITFPLIPRALVLSDFQVFSQWEQSCMIKTFLDHDLMEEKGTLLLISSPFIKIPDGFSGEIELIPDTPMTQKDISLEIGARLTEEEKVFGATGLQAHDLQTIAGAFKGLTAQQVQDVLAGMEGELSYRLKDSTYLQLIRREREKEASKDQAVRFIETSRNETVAGLGCYTKWLKERLNDYRFPDTAQKEGTPAPKGVLLCGVPGTGKTAMARETSRILNVPLIQFDISRIQDSKLGESEARLRRYLERVSAFGSCVMLMDEIEKTFSVNESTHEVKIAMLGQLLDWMQTRKANVFTFITANNISKLPPELLRDGRISERFFAFMPSRDDLCAILRVKLQDIEENNPTLFDPQFRHVITGEGSELADIFDGIAADARNSTESGQYRTPFMTGANLEKLLEITLRALRADGKKPYGLTEFISRMRTCAASSDFVPQAQSNMQDLVDMWLRAQKNQYLNVSNHVVVPFDRFRDGVFGSLAKPDNPYDEYYQETFRTEIEKKAKQMMNEEKAMEKMIREHGN